jgi:hypothetical protein
MSRRDADKRAVLERRALFLGSALAALGGCARTTPPAEHADPAVVAVPTPGSATASAPSPDAGLPERGEKATLGDLPPLDVPDGASEAARQRYEHLARVMTDAHRAIDDISGSVPSCDVGSCEQEWRALARKVFDLDGLFRFFYSCPGGSEEAKAYAERERAHVQHYSERRTAMDKQIADALGSDAARRRWDQLLDDVRTANPVPCLSFACRDW